MADTRTRPPRTAAPTERRTGPRTAPGGAVWYVLGFLLLLALAQAFFFQLQSGETISYSEFKALVREDKVQEVTLSEERVRGMLKAAGSEQAASPSPPSASRTRSCPRSSRRTASSTPARSPTAGSPKCIGWVIPLLFIVGLWTFFLRRMGGAEGGVMSFARSKAKIYADDDVKTSFGDVAGVDEAMGELKEIVEFLKTPKKYTAIGGKIPKGVLLVGPPGTGKTLLARAVAGEAKVPFFSLSGSEFVEMFVGVGAARVRDLFSQAEAKAPCIVFIDELDALGKVRMQSPMGSHEEREQTLNQLLAEMDGFDGRKGIIIMGATNRPEVLDPALLRPGRFDRQVLVDKPDVKGREDILRIHVKTVKIGESVDLRVIAQRTAGFAGADLANLVNEAALLAARKDKTAVEMKDFDDAIDRIIAGLEKKRVMSDKERQIVAYHESGHAIVASILPGLDPVHKISIVARGFGALGYTMQLPLEDRYLMTRAGPARAARRPARRPERRGDRVRRGLDRRAERPAARHRHRARDGHRVRHERGARRGQLRRPPRQQVPRHAVHERARQPFRGHGAEDRRRGEADPHRRAQRGAPRPARAPRHPRPAVDAAAREGSDRGRRAPRAARPGAAQGPRRHDPPSSRPRPGRGFRLQGGNYGDTSRIDTKVSGQRAPASSVPRLADDGPGARPAGDPWLAEPVT